MSSNDFIEIIRVGKKYLIFSKCADVCDEMGNERPIHIATSLRKAIQWAEEYQQEYPAEYGIHFGNFIEGVR